MEDTLVGFKVAKLAKEKGFNITQGNRWIEVVVDGKVEVRKFFDGKLVPYIPQGCKYIEAPTQSLLQRWLREKYRIIINIFADSYPNQGFNWLFQVITYDNEFQAIEDKCTMLIGDNGEYNSYEEALEDGLYKALKLIN